MQAGQAIGGGSTLGSHLARGAVGGFSSVAQGGKFGHGFASGFLSSVAGSYLPDGGSNTSSLVAHAMVGGTISELTGGKFVNGAVSNALMYAMAGPEEIAEVQEEVIINDHLVELVGDPFGYTSFTGESYDVAIAPIVYVAGAVVVRVGALVAGDGGSFGLKKLGTKRNPNKLSADDNASGPHSSFRQGSDGRTTNYETYDYNLRTGQWGASKRFRGIGKTHDGVNPPLIYGRPTGKGPGQKPTIPRKPNSWELPNGY